jgi:TPR repeat protein/S1-C subfamily serine protease
MTWPLTAFLALAAILSSSLARADCEAGIEALERTDYEQAFRRLLPCAEAGDPIAQFNLGLMHDSGEGASRDDAEAVRWYRLAAEQGLAEAQFNLGFMYDTGRGVAQDDAEAVRWYRLAAEQGLADAQFNLALMYHNGEGVPQDDAEVVRWLRLAADQGDARAQFNLGFMYDDGRGVAQDDAEAVRWYRLAAEQGDAEAQLNLALMYHSGEGVPQDDAEAARWYRMAAEQGLGDAQFSLGVSYADGRGVKQDDAKAVRWFRLAAAQGDAGAQFNLGFMYNSGRGVARDFVEAVRWYRMAAEQGLPDAQHNLGMMYAEGRGVPRNDVQAYMWLNLAAARSQGEERKLSAERRDEVAARLTPAQRARGQELARNWQPSAAARSESASGNGAETELRADRGRGLQQRLADLGYDPGPVDGAVGPRTRAAIRAFQADAGLPVDGRISEALFAALESAAKDESPDRRWEEDPQLDSTGTAFAVSQDGHLLTNDHVVADCAVVRVQPPRGKAAATVIVARDPSNDLALLQAQVRLPASAFLDDRGIRAGDGVVAVGFPLHGLLASEASVTTGTVSALAGIGNDTRFLQVTVPVQPGNSGGPLLDLQGRVVGVVVGKLDALEVASLTGDIPQNVNFAIKAGVARSFLQASGLASKVEPTLEAAYGEQPQELSPAQVGAQAKAFAVLVECWK